MKAQPNLEYLQQLLMLDIPQPEPRELGFLDVVNHTTRETTICNVYRYFLDSELSPQISGLMKGVLEQLLKDAIKARSLEKSIDLSAYDVITEYNTGNGRIDILLDNNNAKSAVIIEAKIYHNHGNDLKDYWDTIPYPNEQKVGVILGLWPTHYNSFPKALRSTLREHFVCITHADWLNAVTSNGLPHDLPIKDFIYFKDFVNNINHLTHSHDMTPEIEFYLEHSAKVESAIATKNAAMQFVLDQIETAAGKLDLVMCGSDNSWRNLRHKSKIDPVFYTVFPENIIKNSGEVTIVMELSGKNVVAQERDLHLHLKDCAKAQNLTPSPHKKVNYSHFLATTVKLTPESLDLLAKKIFDTITNDLEPVRQKLLKALNNTNEE